MLAHTHAHSCQPTYGKKTRVSSVLSFLVVMTCLLIGCGTRPQNPPPTKPTQITTSARRPLLGEEFSLQGGATVFVDLPNDTRGSAIELRFMSVINDSRCPRHVECAVAGDATVLLSATFAQTQQSLELHTTPPLNTGRATIANYEVQLVDLDPQLESFAAKPDLTQYTVHLRVSDALPATVTAIPASPTPTAYAIPRTAKNACTLVSAGTVEDLFGGIQGIPQPQFNANDGAQECTIQTERGILTIHFIIGDEADARALVENLQRAGIPLSDLSADPRGLWAFGQNQQQAMLVSYAFEAIIALGITFSSQAQPDDHTQARYNLETLQSLAFTRYAAGQVELMATPQKP